MVPYPDQPSLGIERSPQKRRHNPSEPIIILSPRQQAITQRDRERDVNQRFGLNINKII